MQISKLNSTNFGTMYYKFERPDRKMTQKQRKAMQHIEREVFVANLENDLEKQNTDIIATMKRDGNISLKLSKILYSWFDNIKNESYVPTKGTGNQKIQVKFNLQKSVQPHLIKKQMERFIKNSQAYMLNPLSGNNGKIEDAWEAKMERLADSAMAQFSDTPDKGPLHYTAK